MKTLLVGAGGYASIYAKELLNIKNQSPENQITDFCAIVDPFIKNAPLYDKIVEAKIPLYETLEDFYKNNTADLAVIATPPYLHKDQTTTALMNGSNVLCEKPVAPTVEEVNEIIACSEKTGKFVGIGYQWSFSDAIQRLKKDILDGLLGKPLCLKTFISWPRNKAYYGRTTGWGGKKYYRGKPIYDSILSNACAHYMHNMLFVLGNAMNESAEPVRAEAVLMRANDIENFDTCTVKAYTASGTPMLFVASHAADKVNEPEFEYRFENGTVRYSRQFKNIKAEFTDGTVKNYGNPFEREIKKLYDCIECSKTGVSPICTAKTAKMHTKLVEFIAENFDIKPFTPDRIMLDESENRLYVPGLYEELKKAYDNFELFSAVLRGLG